MKKYRIRNISYSITLCYILLSGFCFFNCKSDKNKINPSKLCYDFYQLNKNMNMDGLFNIQILGIREYSEYNKEKQKIDRIPSIIGIDNSVSRENIKLFVFKNGADLTDKKLSFRRCNPSMVQYLVNKYEIKSNTDTFNCYVKEIESIYSKYYLIQVPDYLPYTNIKLNGCGNYIEFILMENEEQRIRYSCLYVKDSKKSNEELKEYFSKLTQLDEHWYYDVTSK